VSRPSPLTFAAAAVAALIVVPIAYLVIRGSEDRAGLGAMLEPAFGALVVRSLALALTVGAVATLIAVLLAVAVEAVDLPLRRLATVLVVLPLAIPSYVAATAYVAGLSPLGPFGALASWLGVGPIFPEGFGWAAFVLVTSTVPLAFLPLRAALARADGDLYDAARTLGRSRNRALAVALRPVLGSAARAGFVVVVLYTLAELGTVAILRFDALPRVIYHQFLSAFDRAAAARSALVLVVLVLVFVVVAARTAASRQASAGGLGLRGRPLRLHLGGARWLAALAVALYVLVAAVVPLVSLLSWLFKSSSVTGAHLGRAFLGSVQAAAIVVVPALLAAGVVAVVAERGGRTGRVISRLVEAGYALPGLVVALGFSVATLRLAPSLYQGWAPYTLAMMLLYVPLGVAAIRGSLATVPPQLEEAARTLGATRRAAFWRVTLPIVRPGVLAAAALIVISTMKELGASLLLLPTGKTTLAVQLWDSTEEARYGLAAPPALLLIALAALAAFAVDRRRLSGDRT
jgi:iron(III) transport system permease protein